MTTTRAMRRRSVFRGVVWTPRVRDRSTTASPTASTSVTRTRSVAPSPAVARSTQRGRWEDRRGVRPRRPLTPPQSPLIILTNSTIRPQRPLMCTTIMYTWPLNPHTILTKLVSPRHTTWGTDPPTTEWRTVRDTAQLTRRSTQRQLVTPTITVPA